MKIIPLILALGLAVGGFIAPSAPATPDEGALTVVASPAFAGVLRPGQSLLVSGTVTNSSGEALDAGTASVYLAPSRMVTKSAVHTWLTDAPAASSSLTGDAVATLAIGQLAVGQVKGFTITVAPTTLAFLTGEAGVFPLEVRLTSGNVVLASRHSAVSWYPEATVSRLNVATVLPINAPSSTTGLLTSEDLNKLTSVGGALYLSLNTALTHTVAMAVDPMIVASIRLLGDGAPQAAKDWLQRLETAPSDIFALSYADTDQLLWRQAGVTTPLTPLSFPKQNTVVPSPTPSDTLHQNAPAATPSSGASTVVDNLVVVPSTIDNLAWPSQSSVSEKDLDFLSTGGFTRTLVSSSDVVVSSPASPNVLIGDRRVTVSDADISRYLFMAATAKTDSEWAQSAAALTATLAVTAIQNPAGTVVATLARTETLDPRMLVSVLNSVESLPWVNPLPLSSALTVTAIPGSLAVTEGADGTASHKDLVAQAVQLLDSEGTVTQFSSVAADPTLVTGPQRLSLLALMSATWSGEVSGWSTAIQQHLSDNGVLLSAVHIPESSSITFPLEKGNLPIAVRNELNFPVTVWVTVRPERAILKVLDDRVMLSIEANSQAKVFVPVESIANGEVLTTVSLSSATGVAISQPAFVVLNVQAGWETTATVVLAVIVIALFGAGVWREVRRRRKPRPTRDEPEQEKA